MGVNVIGAILRVILENENRGVLPICAVRYRLDDAPNCEIVVRDCRGRRGDARLGGRGVIVGQAQQDELRHGILPRSPLSDELPKFVEELVRAQLIGKIQIEIRITWIEVINQFWFRSDILRNHRNFPRPQARTAVWLAEVVGQFLAGFYRIART